jgi:hypothetical protein
MTHLTNRHPDDPTGFARDVDVVVMRYEEGNFTVVNLATNGTPSSLKSAAFEIDVDMGAQMRGAARMHASVRLPAHSSVVTGRRGRTPFVPLDATHPGQSRHMRHPRQPHQGLVEVHVTIERWRGILADCGYTSAINPDIDETPVSEPAMGKEGVEC